MTFIRPAPGDREQIVDPRSGLHMEAVALYEAMLTWTSRVAISEIRTYFQINPDAKAYRWRGVVRDNGEVETSKDSKIHVAMGHPEQDRFWPYIVLKSIGGQQQDLWLGQKEGSLIAPNPAYSRADAIQAQRDGDDYAESEYLDVGERRGGKLTLNLKFEVGALGGKAENLRVTDSFLHGLQVAIRMGLEQRGLAWIPNSNTIGDEDTPPLQGAQERSRETIRVVSFSLWTGWHRDYYYTAPIVDDVLIQRAFLQGTEPPLPTP